jgi:putative hydrolase of the HAD superfamily
LSDQSDWLDLLDREHHFFHEFDRVFNSYHLGKTKRDASVFDDVVRALELEASEALLVDDNPAHVQRAVSRGLMGHLFLSVSHLKAELERLAVL